MANAAIVVLLSGIFSLLIAVMPALRTFSFRVLGAWGVGIVGTLSFPGGLRRGLTQAVYAHCGHRLRIGSATGASRHTVVAVKRLHHQLWQEGEEKNPSQSHSTTEGAELC